MKIMSVKSGIVLLKSGSIHWRHIPPTETNKNSSLIWLK